MMKLINIKSNCKLMYNKFYFIVFIGFGAISPLLSIYLKEEVNLTGTQVGTIMSIIPIAVVFTQPLWGIINDYLKKTKMLLQILLLAISVIALAYLAVDNFIFALVITFMYSVLNCGIGPLSDGLAVAYANLSGCNYSSIRLWGSIGYAAAPLIIGFLTKYFGMNIMFVLPAVMFFMAVFICNKLPINMDKTSKINIKKDLAKVIKVKEFQLFTAFAFLVFGSMNSGNGVYSSLYIVENGGDIQNVMLITSIGVAVEVIVMVLLSRRLKKVNYLHVIIIGTLLVALRWLIYFLKPPIAIIYCTCILHGISSGLFISSTINYLVKIVPQNMVTTAITLNGSLGTGFGSWIITFFGGIIYDKYGLCILYLIYSILAFVGLTLCFIMLRHDRTANNSVKFD